MPGPTFIPPAADAPAPKRYPKNIKFISLDELHEEAKDPNKGPAYVFSQPMRALKLDEIKWKTTSSFRNLTHNVTVDYVRFVGQSFLTLPECQHS